MKTKVCKMCNIVFSGRNSGTTYCSRKCLWSDKEWTDKINKSKKCPRPNSQGKKRPSASGDNNYRWKGGNRKDNRERHILMGKLEYKQWRTSVFERDNWTCQTCGVRGVYLEAHHIKGWKDFVELRYVVSNGVTLCRECHNLTKNKK